MTTELLNLLGARNGHFRFESGHHGDLWLDLDLVFLRPARVRRFATELARLLSRHGIDAVCGPIMGGAFVAEMIASELDVEFYYSERLHPQRDGLHPMKYRIADAHRGRLRDKAVAVVDDVINAGSAVRATLTDLEACGARPVAIGALLVLGSSAGSLAADKRIPLESITQLPNVLWTPAECPLCASGVPLENRG